MTFKITIEEAVSETFEVEADSIEDAYNMGIENYYSGEFVLEPGECTCRQIQIINPKTGECTEWDEF